MTSHEVCLNVYVPATDWSRVVVAAVVWYFLWNKYGQGLNRIPGPALAGYSLLWRLYDVAMGRAHWTMIDLHKKHGKLVRIGPNKVSVSDPKAIPIIYGVNPRFKKTGFYPSQSISWNKANQPNLFSTLNEKYHDEEKKKVANAYSLTSLLGMEPAVDACSNLFIDRLGPFADSGQSFDLGIWLEYYAFDVVGEMTFSKRMGFLEQGKDVDGMLRGIVGMLQYNAIVGQVHGLHKILLGNPLFPVFFPQMESWDQVVTFTLKAMNERASIRRNEELDVYQVQDLGKDMLSNWSNVKKNDPLKMSTRDIIVHTSTNVFAGSGTTSITLRAIIYFLCKNPDKMNKLVNQIDEANRAGLLSNPVSYKESIEKLPYMEAIMKEALRIHPGIGLILERHVPEGGMEICGEHIPGGTTVGVNAWVTHYDANVFPEPHSFIPERWLDCSPAKKIEMERSFFTFGAGARTCLGRYIAFIEILKVVPQIFRNFEVALTDPDKDWNGDVTNRWMVQIREMKCNLKRRACQF